MCCELIFLIRLLSRVMTSTLQGWEEVIEQDALAWLDLSAFTLRSFLFTVSWGWFWCAAPPRANCWNILWVDLCSSPRVVATLIFTVVEDPTWLGSLSWAGAFWPRWQLGSWFWAHRPIRILLDYCLLLLNNLLELFFTELAEKFFVEDRHHSTFLLLCDQLLKKNCLIVLRHVGNCIQSALFRPISLLCWLFSHRSELLRRCRLHGCLLIVPLRTPCSIRLRCNELLVALSGLAGLGGLRALLLGDAGRFLASRGACGGLSLRWCLHQSLEWVVLAHALCRAAHYYLLVRYAALFTPWRSILRDLVIDHHSLWYFTLTSLLLLHIDLVHLMLLSLIHLLLHHLSLVEHTTITYFLAITLLLLLHLLLLLFEEHHLLDLLLGQLLIYHLLLCREVILFNLLATALDLEFIVLILNFSIFVIITAFLVFLVHDFPILVILFLLLLHLSGLEHEQLLLLLFCQLLHLIVVNFFLALFAILNTLVVFVPFLTVLFSAVQLGINELLELLLWYLERIGVLLVLFLEIGD